jgi:hypothetical protein
MKKWLLLCFFALPWAALFGQFTPNTQNIAILQMPDIPLAITILGGSIPPVVINGSYDSGVTFGDQTVNHITFGADIGADGFSLSGIGIGVSWDYSIQRNQGAPYLSLSFGTDNFGIPESFVINLGFDTPGIDVSPQNAFNAYINGTIDQTIFTALYNGSSPGWQTAFNYDFSLYYAIPWTYVFTIMESNTDAEAISSIMAGAGGIGGGGGSPAPNGGGDGGNDFATPGDPVVISYSPGPCG